MLNVYYSIDVEVWCDGWADLDRRFPGAFMRYIYGQTEQGQFGLEYQLRTLSERGLKAVCFVEPLFAACFGLEPLKEIVGLIKGLGHEVQLHLHPEWASESRSDWLPRIPVKRRHLREFSFDEQLLMISAGKRLLEAAGATEVRAFRAGNFGMNAETVAAVGAAGLTIDCSYNASMGGLSSGFADGELITEPLLCGAVVEVPMTVFRDGIGGLHHAQLCACSAGEMSLLLERALESERKAFVILSHNFELMNRRLTHTQPAVIKRLHFLCDFLGRQGESFSVKGLNDVAPTPVKTQPPPLRSTAGRTLVRRFEQISGLALSRPQAG